MQVKALYLNSCHTCTLNFVRKKNEPYFHIIYFDDIEYMT